MSTAPDPVPSQAVGGGSGRGDGSADRPPAPPNAGTARHRTIFDPGLDLEAAGAIRPAPVQASPRRVGGGRLVGWLVSFTLDPAGVDFPLREGRNVLGAGGECDLVIEGDPGISEVHAILVFRGGELQIRDNDSTNGTYVNGEDIFGRGVRLDTGDRIRLGKVDLSVHLL